MRNQLAAAALVLTCIPAAGGALLRPDAPVLKPDAGDVPYASYARATFDLWKARSEEPTPLVVFFHGGAFVTGDKRQVSMAAVRRLVGAGISVASANYRLMRDGARFPAPFHDSARAIQFLRHHARQYNVDPARIAAWGNSAGGGITLWVAMHDDLADPAGDDPVARQSSRVRCAVAWGAQSTYDPRVGRKIGVGDLAMHPVFLLGYGLKPAETDTPEAHKLYAEASPITHASADDPPLYLSYSQSAEFVAAEVYPQVHHPGFGLFLKQRLDELKVPCDLVIRHKRYERKGDRLVAVGEAGSMQQFLARYLVPPRQPASKPALSSDACAGASPPPSQAAAAGDGRDRQQDGTGRAGRLAAVGQGQADARCKVDQR